MKKDKSKSIPSVYLRRRAEKSLSKKKAYDELERMVKERTAELSALNDQLKEEIEVRKKAEEALRMSEEKYRMAIDFTYDWEYWLGPDGQYIYVSPSCERVTGYRPDAFSADPDLIAKIAYPDDRTMVAEHFCEALQSGSDVHQMDFRIIARNGEVRWISHRCQPVYREDGSWVGRRGSNRDITKRKKAQEEVQNLNRELEQYILKLTEMNRELDAFTHTISHNLKAPLFIIGGFTNRLQKNYWDKLDTDGKVMLNAIQMNTQKMNRLIKDFLAFSRSGRQQIKPTKIDMGNLVTTVLDELKSLLEWRMIKFDIKALPRGYGDRALIKQVFINLLSSAIKFTSTKEKAVIEVGSKVEENENIYYVKDNGVGFNPQDKDKLFSPFHRLSGTKEFEGTGVGLSIVQRIVNRHGGQVWAEGKVNEGATFYFSLPKRA